MRETGASEEDARQHIQDLVTSTWMKMNEDSFRNSLFSKTFIDIAMNVARTAQCVYQYGDGHASQEHETQRRLLALLINPIPE